MKKLYFVFLFFVLKSAAWSQQLTVTATGNNCQADVKYLSVNFGTLTPANVVWSSMPAGAVFSVSPPFTATVSFPSAAAYTVIAMAISQNSMVYGAMEFTIIPSPTVTLSQNSFTTCLINNANPQMPYALSKPVNLIASGATSYTIFPLQGPPITTTTPGAFTVRPPSTTCYTVVGEIANGCTGTAISCVTVIPQFSIQLSPSPAYVCANDSVKLSVSNVQSSAVGPSSSFMYNWYEATNAPPPSLDSYGTASVMAYPQNTTTYTVEVADARGCISSPALVVVNVGLCTNLAEHNATAHYLAFPNPVTDKFKLRSEVNGAINGVELMNTLGNLVYTIGSVSANEEIDIAFLAPGIYFVRVQTKSGSGILKIVKH